MVVDEIESMIGRAAKPTSDGFSVALRDAELTVSRWPRFSVRILRAAEGTGMTRGDTLAVFDVADADGELGLAVTFCDELALKTGHARHHAEPDPEALASARAFVTSLAQVADADARSMLRALSALDGAPERGDAIAAALFGRAGATPPT